MFVSPSGARSIWLRNNLSCFKDRLKSLEDQVAKEGIMLTEAQVAILEKKKHDDQASGEIETVHPGYLDSQDTFYVGTPSVLAGSISKHLWIHIQKWLSS